MTEQELTAIEGRANAATLGPWEGKENIGMVSKHDACDTVFETGCGCCTENDLSAENAAFIAAARVDVPALIAEVRKLIAERDALLLRCKEAEAGWLLATTQRDDFAVSLVMARDGGK